MFWHFFPWGWLTLVLLAYGLPEIMLTPEGQDRGLREKAMRELRKRFMKASNNKCK
jgi:hypothetical protein